MYSRFSGSEYRDSIRSQRQNDIDKRSELRQTRREWIEEIKSLKEQRRNARSRAERDALTEEINTAQFVINGLTEAIDLLTDEIDMATEQLQNRSYF